MLLWIGFAILTAGLIAYLARPLLGPAESRTTAHAADVAVYRDQLAAIDAEREQGLLDAAEADAARTELARRLLRAADEEAGAVEPHMSRAASQQRSEKAGDSNSVSRLLVIAAGALIPLLAVGIYLAVGSPNLPGLPFAERIAQSNQGRSVGDLIGLVEARLREHPDDAQGWEVLAPVYMKQQRYDEAARAYANVLRLSGESPERVAGFAEALVLANNGVVVPDARKAYQRLLALAPDRPEPRFWLALAKEQDGDLAGSIADLEAMLKSAPATAPWRSLVESKLADLRTGLSGGDGASQIAPKSETGPAADATPSGPSVGAASVRAPGPGAADIAAAEQMSPEQRSAFITQMVEGLAARLAENGKDLEGWKRLTRAYKVMGREADAVKALADARKAFDGDKAALDILDALAKDLGIGS